MITKEHGKKVLVIPLASWLIVNGAPSETYTPAVWLIGNRGLTTTYAMSPKDRTQGEMTMTRLGGRKENQRLIRYITVLIV